jgi:hypothetical protein
MILEEATFDAFGYYPSELKRKSGKSILVACEFCGEFRVTTKNLYSVFCKSCSPRLGGKSKGNAYALGYKHTKEEKAKMRKNSPDRRGKNNSFFEKTHTKEAKALQSKNHPDTKGKKNSNWKPKIKCICVTCKKIFYVYPYRIKCGRGIYCSRPCARKAQKHEKGEKSPNYKGGILLAWKRANAKRRRQLSYTLLMPLAEGDVGHHVTNEFVIGIPVGVHNSMGGRRKRHRALVLQWLKENDITKYKLVLEVL